MEYLLSFIAASFAIGLLYYRELYKKCVVQKENIKKNTHLWEDWGE
jgi:biotin transporter BioY